MIGDVGTLHLPEKNSPHMLKFGTLPDSTFNIFFKAGRDLVQRLRTFVGPKVTILFRDKWQMRRFHASAVFGADCRAILNDSSWCQPIKPFGPTGERSKHGQSQGAKSKSTCSWDEGNISRTKFIFTLFKSLFTSEKGWSSLNFPTKTIQNPLSHLHCFCPSRIGPLEASGLLRDWTSSTLC